MVEYTPLNIERIPFQVELVTRVINLVEGESIFWHKINLKLLFQKFLADVARVTYFYVQSGEIFHSFQILINN